MHWLLISFFIALVAYTYSIVLTAPGMLLDWLYIWMSGKLEKDHEKLFNVLINCPKCVAGQWSLWVFFLIPNYQWWLSFKLLPFKMGAIQLYFFTFNYQWLAIHILFITITIWFSIILNKLYLWLTN